MGAIEPAHIKEPLELHKELEALSPVDKQRLRMIAKKYAAVAGDMEPEDLLQEAMLKVFEVDPQNRRNCRSDLDALTFMASTMRSLASSRVEWRKRREEAAALETTHADYNLLTAMKADPNQKSPEQALLSSENEEAFQAFLLDECKGCEKTQLVLLGGFDGLRGKALCDAAGVTKSELATIHKRINRMLDRYQNERSVS